jgi:YggT family protein
MAIYNEMERNAELNVAEKERAIAAANQNSAIARFVRIIYFLFGVLEVLLAVRVVLHVLAANAGNGFADLIYGLTNPFVAPFSTLLANPNIGAGVLELTTIVAMIAYAILAWVIGRIIWLALSRPR